MSLKPTPLALLFLLLTSLLQAQPYGTREARVLFFSEPDFRGECLEVYQNTDFFNLADIRDRRGHRWDDRFASVLIEGPARVTLYADPRYRGERIELRSSVRDLREIQDLRGQELPWDHRVSAAKVYFDWESSDYRGEHRGYRDEREADRVIRRIYREILGRDPDEAGLRHYRSRLMTDGWGEDELRRALRDSREFSNRDYEGIVRRIYREVLHRDPDPEGLRSYAANLRDRRWSEDDLRREIRRSEEARETRAREIVIRAYRDILGRDPDAEGLRSYQRKIMDGMDENRLRDILRGSEEARNRRKK